MNIERAKNVTKLDLVTTRPDLRRDLHVFVDYVRDRDVKRTHRENGLSKTDARRLAKLVSDPDSETEVNQDGYSFWIDFVDQQAYKLGIVEYDIEGVYVGYTSHEPSFPDNYIKFNAKRYNKLVSLKLADLERELLDSFIEGEQGNHSEFFSGYFTSRLSRFDTFGSATGVIPMLDIAGARRFLLDLLACCPTGEWLSVASLVQHLKTAAPFFLIPKKPKFENKWDVKKGRYGNFYESTKQWGPRKEVKESEADAFERVEGRYVERFLEGIPNLLGYLDVGYVKREPKGIYPSLGHLKAFRVSDRLKRALKGEIAEPTVTVAPNFDVYVQAELYASRVMQSLTPLCDLVSEDVTTVLRLDRQKVAVACAADAKLDVTQLLDSLSTEPLPENVRRELADWSAHGEKFILYTNCSLLETDGKADIEQYRVENIAKGIDLVRSPAELFNQLEEQQLAPLKIKHGDKTFSPVPPKTRSAFPRRKATGKSREAKSKVTLMRVTRVQLHCPDREFLDRLQCLLAEANCPVKTSRKSLSVVYSNRHQKQVDQAIRALKTDFEVKIDDQ